MNGVSVTQGNGASLSNNTATSSSIVVTFTKKVTMAEAQEYIREQVVFTPMAGNDSTVKLTASDGVISVSSTTTITASVYN